MDCCENTKTDAKKEATNRNVKESHGRRSIHSLLPKFNQMKGGKSMVEITNRTMLWIVIGILLIAAIFLTFKASAIGTAPAQATASAVKTAASTASSGMVGGC